MSFRPRFPAPAALFTVLASLAAGPAHAEDPFLGQIREIKCVNCRPGWVTLVVHDPIETRDFELYLKDTDYNKIISPLPGKRIHDRNGECFYWMERPKKPRPGAKPGPEPAAASPKGPAVAPVVPDTVQAAADPDKTLTAAVAGADTPLVVPPPEPEGTPSACIRFFRQMK